MKRCVVLGASSSTPANYAGCSNPVRVRADAQVICDETT
jgi:hypothetical protein